MPFTAFHAGPNGLLGMIFFKWLNLPALILVNIAMDLEPLVILVFKVHGYPEHGFSHTFGGAIIIGLIFSVLYEQVKVPVNRFMGFLSLRQLNSITSIIMASIIGGAIHVILDSFLYRDIMPFYPSDINPFYGAFSPSAIRLFCMACFGVSAVLYVTGLLTGFYKKNSN
jgi:hypothetical protein